MTHEEFIGFVNHPDTLTVEQLVVLKEMVERYPYFVPARLLLLKLYQSQQEIHFESEARKASMYVHDRRWLYYFLYPEYKLSQTPIPREVGRKSSGDYFDLMHSVGLEGEESKHLLSDLVTKLKSARMMMTDDQAQASNDQNLKTTIRQKSLAQGDDTEMTSNKEQEEFENLSLQIKKLIAQHRYQDAIDILEAYNLNNPKKSVYFADQIRFLKKVIAISK